MNEIQDTIYFIDDIFSLNQDKINEVNLFLKSKILIKIFYNALFGYAIES